MAKATRKKATRKTAPKSRPKGKATTAKSAKSKTATKAAKPAPRRAAAPKKAAPKTAPKAVKKVAKSTPKAAAAPESRYPALIPYLTVSDANSALDFYEKAFGAKTRNRMQAEDGKRLMHAETEMNGSVFMLADDFPEWSGGRTPEKFGGTSVTVHVNLTKPAQVDALVEKAAMHGAKIEMQPTDAMWGDRYAEISDPFGHRWSIGAPLPGKTAPTASDE